jgi:hypothetical protein
MNWISTFGYRRFRFFRALFSSRFRALFSLRARERESAKKAPASTFASWLYLSFRIHRSY